MVTKSNRRWNLFMAKPIEATPILKDEDAVEFLKAFESKKPTTENVIHRNEAYSLLRKVLK